MIKNFFKKITGLQALENAKEHALEEARAAVKLAAQAQAELEAAKAAEEAAKLSPKERATAQGMPYVAVLDTHVNKDNVRNGFFELDWNEYFVVQLKQAGYGYDGDPDEEIVDRWFRDLARNILAEEGQDPTRGAGYINVTKLAGGKAEAK
jgi:multidrug efflux pump subunit AcrA (membrane-fusion protein)